MRNHEHLKHQKASKSHLTVFAQGFSVNQKVTEHQVSTLRMSGWTLVAAIDTNSFSYSSTSVREL